MHRAPFRAATALAGLLVAANAATAAPEAYEIDPDHFSIGFMASHVGYQNQLGMFLEAKGSFTYDAETQTFSNIKIVIDADSVFTNHRRRDRHLRSADFLNAGEFPKIVFTGTRAEPLSDATGRVHGELELLGTRRPVTLEVTLNKAARYPFGHRKFTLGISARTRLPAQRLGHEIRRRQRPGGRRTAVDTGIRST